MRPDTPCPRPAIDTLANWPGRALAHVPRTMGGGGGPHGDVMAPPHLLLPERAVVPTASLRSLLIECQKQRKFPFASVSDTRSPTKGSVVPTASLRSLLIECQRQKKFPFASVSDTPSPPKGSVVPTASLRS